MFKKNISTIFFLLFMKFLLEMSYVYIIQPIFSYEGYMLDISLLKMVESYVLVLIVFIPMVFSLEKKEIPSKIIIYLISLFLFLPLSSLYWLQNQPRVFLYSISLSLLIIVLYVSFVPNMKFVKLNEGKKILYAISIFMTIAVYGMVLIEGGLSRINFDLLDVYNVRSEYSSSSNIFLGYMLPWQAYGINMLILAIALYKKKIPLAVVIIVLQVFLFSMTNFKSYLFAPIVLVAFHYFSKTKFKENLLLIMSIGSVIIITLSTLIYYLFKDVLMVSIFVRRLYFAPANLHYIYFDFFESIEKYKLSHSVLSAFFENNYGMTPVKLVALNYFGKDFSPNVGFYGDAYLNFGIFGILLFSILLAILLKLIDTISFNVPTFLTISILVIPSMALVNSAFFTSLSTHGIIFVVVLIWLVNSYFNNEKAIK